MYWTGLYCQLVAVADVLLVFTVSVAQVVTGSERCGYRDTPVSTTQQDVQMFGVCVPYDSSTVPGGTPCDPLYTQEVTYVYVPFTRVGYLEGYLSFFQDTQLTFDLVPEECVDEARVILCHYFLPPCGNITVFEPPTSVCEDVCEYLRSLCPTEFELVEAYFEQRADLLTQYGLTMINCSDTGEYLNELDHCCSDLSIDISCMKVNGSGDLVPDPLCERSQSTDNSLSVGGYIGICAAIVIIIIVISIALITLAILIRKHKHHEETQAVKDPTTEERSKSSDPTRYWQSNNDQLLSPPIPDSTLRVARVSSGYIRQMADVNLLIPGRSLHLMDTLGQGEFGVVYRGKLKAWGTKGEECLVAAKTLKGVFGTTELSNLMEESMKMSKFNHPNVMKLIGVCIEKGTSPFIVMPYMAYGSLLSYLKKKRAELTLASDDDTELVTTTQSKLLSMCLQVSKGMSYLATQQFVHRDLAARNCMIDENFVLKVADFGLSEDIYSKHYFRQGIQVTEEGETPVKLPVRWMAIESLHDGIFTEKSDVWSFGVTMWEIFSLGKIPYPGVDAFSVTQFLDDGRRLSLPANAACSQDIYTIMCHCWAENPDQRPHFSDLVSTLTNTLESIGGYLIFSDLSVNHQPQISSYDHLIPVQPLEDHLKPTVIVSDCDPGNELDSISK